MKRKGENEEKAAYARRRIYPLEKLRRQPQNTLAWPRRIYRRIKISGNFNLSGNLICFRKCTQNPRGIAACHGTRRIWSNPSKTTNELINNRGSGTKALSEVWIKKKKKMSADKLNSVPRLRITGGSNTAW
jgi:hypothetical protein